MAVEGYTDVIALHQGGITESVAIMGTALTQQQLTTLAQRVGKDGTVYLALDADRAGQEAMLRASRGARDLDLELRVVDMPEGADPAELVAADGADAFARRLDGARLVPDFEARRVVRSADMSSPRGRDRALEQVRPLVRQLPANSATRDDLVAFLADRLDVPLEYVETDRAVPAPRFAPPQPEQRPAADPAPVELGSRLERDVLAMCLAAGEAGREQLERLTDEHFSAAMPRLARAHLVAHYDDPLGALPDSDPALAALVTELVMRGQEEESSNELLRLTFLQLELRRLDRQARHAMREGDLEAQRALAPERQTIKDQIDELMGQTL